MTDQTRPMRVAIAGVHGYGSVHLERLEAMRGEVELVAVADPRQPPAAALPPATAVYPSLLDVLLVERDIDIVIIATPLDTHFELAELALRSGADVYLEKPPVTSVDAFDRLREVERHNTGSIQVGFQGLALHHSPVFRSAVASIGEIRSVGAIGLWQRSDAYWKRSRWAGRRILDGVDIVDGVITNPFAHAVASALRVAGAHRRSQIAGIDVDLYRANPIESDDTSVVRIRTDRGVTITGAFTLCAASPVEPSLLVTGSTGAIRFWYTEGMLQLADGSVVQLEHRGLLENLVEHRRDRAVPLLSPLEDSAPFMAVLDVIRTAAEPAPIPQQFLERVGEATTVVTDIARWAELAVARQATFAEVGAPWGRQRSDSVVASLVG